MKVVTYQEYGDPQVLHETELDKPAPKEHEIQVRVYATTVNFGDIMARKFNRITPKTFYMPSIFLLFARLQFGFQKPKKAVLGSEFAGQVEGIGRDVTSFKVGDQVFGYLGQEMGTYAEYISIHENSAVAIKPDGLSFEEAASIPYGAVMALDLLRKADIRPGQNVLIIGASGSIGAAAVQLARNHFGARVTGVCSTPRVELVKSLGAEQVIDYTQEDFTRNGNTYDLIIDVLGKSSFSQCRSSLTQDGRYLPVSFKMRQLLQMLWTSMFSTQKVICALAPGGSEALKTVKELIDAGKIKAFIDRRFPLAQTAEAHRYVEDGYKKGSIVISLQT